MQKQTYVYTNLLHLPVSPIKLVHLEMKERRVFSLKCTSLVQNRTLIEMFNKLVWFRKNVIGINAQRASIRIAYEHTHCMAAYALHVHCM
jgi:hypothetical protein